MSDIRFDDSDEKFWKAVRREQEIYNGNTNIKAAEPVYGTDGVRR